jgi:hypothetical protein
LICEGFSHVIHAGMVSSLASWRGLMTYGLCLPLAIFLGYHLTASAGLGISVAGLCIIFLSLPLLLRWHHVLLLVCWNAYLNAFFLPGQPNLWMVLALMSLGISILSRTLDRETKFLSVPQVNYALGALFVVVLVTAMVNGGIGFRIFGSETFGGKRYIWVFGAILGYFSLTALPLPRQWSGWITTLFFLSGATAFMSNLAYALGPSFYFMFLLFPPEWAMHHFLSDYAPSGDTFLRISGITPAAIAIISAMLVRYGFEGIFTLQRPWRALLFIGVIFASMFGGFRSNLVLLFLIFGFQFYFERIYRTRIVPVLMVLVVCSSVILIPFAHQLPLSAQRALTVLPLKLDPIARRDAETSTQWRLDMWKLLWPEVPNYLVLGKGFAMAPVDLYLTDEAVKRGYYKSYEQAIVSGDYHSGPFSLLLPFGLPGFAAFVWFLYAGFRVVYNNYRYGDPALSKINTFLVSYFLARSIFFFAIFGSIYSDLLIFTGIVGLSVTLNRGMQLPNNRAIA